jgi:MFS transporter, ACS family, hexuronate transporter
MSTLHDNSAKPAYWQWVVSFLLLLATMINYMDRQTLANLSVRITTHFNLSEPQYGLLETVFGVSFAVGSLFFGVLADRWSVRILYPVVLVSWSAIGFLTGLSQGYASLMVCRALLGFFEAGHWPCALIVTQSVLSSGNRTMGNGLLQSGASLGAIITPQIIRKMVSENPDAEAWRTPFLVIGAIGLAWAVVWLFVIKRSDLPDPAAQRQAAPTQPKANFSWVWEILRDRRFIALAVMVVCLNTSWQLVRAWLPKFMQQGRGYTEADTLNFNSLFYLATDIGCLLSGAAALWLVRRGWQVHSSRMGIYLFNALLASLTIVAAQLPAGPALMALLLLIGAGLLGLFPCYYSLTQELPKATMGRVTGMLSFIGWLASAPMQTLFGAIIEARKSYDLVMGLVGLAPLLGFICFYLLWPRTLPSNAP